MNTLELLLLRQWLRPFEDSLVLDKKFTKAAQDTRKKIDKTLWATYISPSTPWGEVDVKPIELADDEFDKTVEEVFGRKLYE